MKGLFFIFAFVFFSVNFCVAQQNEFSLKNTHLIKNKPNNISLNQQKADLTNVPVVLFKRMPNYLKKENKRPIFCELEHQLSRTIKRNVKFGVEP